MRDEGVQTFFFDPTEPVAFLCGKLPHWRQTCTTYFVTFRLADSLPREQLEGWEKERKDWLSRYPEPLGVAERRKYYELFPERLHNWLDAGSGSCILALPEARRVVSAAIRHFEGVRYQLGEFVVAVNHVHALVTPFETHELSTILHSWKSFTAHQLPKLGGEIVDRLPGRIWQKESFDHIVRSPESLAKFGEYIRRHREYEGT